MGASEAARYEVPFDRILTRVKPERASNKRAIYRDQYWQHVEARPALRAALSHVDRFIGTPRVAKHRLFVWLRKPILPDSAIIAFGRRDDYFFGVMHSRFNEVWALKLGTQLETRPRYTPTTCFETFPFPWPLGEEDSQSAAIRKIAEAAASLVDLRDRWLNPPEWTRTIEHRFPALLDGPWGECIEDRSAERPVAVYRKLAAVDPKAAAALKKRTLTGLYNEQPRWLTDAHRSLDEVVAAAYNEAAGEIVLSADSGDDDILGYLLRLNLERAR